MKDYHHNAYLHSICLFLFQSSELLSLFRVQELCFSHFNEMIFIRDYGFSYVRVRKEEEKDRISYVLGTWKTSKGGFNNNT